MTDPRPEEGAREQRPEPTAAPAPSWHDFGVPHGGAPEAPAYTPAFRERPRPEPSVPMHPVEPTDRTEPNQPVQPRPDGDVGTDVEIPSADLTQPIDTSATQEVPPVARVGEEPHSWWSSPGDDSPWVRQSGAVGAASGSSLAAPSGALYAMPWPPALGDSPAPPSHGATTAPALPRPPEGPAGPGRLRWAALAALALLVALLGGGVALAGQQLLNRGATLGTAVPAPGPGSTARPEGSIAKIAADALPSVVTIRIKTAQGQGTGSGFVIDKQGHILTNNHVVAAAGTSGAIGVELNNGKTLPATVTGADASSDLAVIKVEATDLLPLEFGASKDVVVGDGVIAVGAPLGLDATVTSGIVSALNRPVTPGDGNDQSFINAIQTDAAINPGNSGGPLLDMNGRVIGVNSAIARIPGSTSDSGGNIGVGFAIPSDQASKTAQQLITTGKADHPVLGVNVDRTFTGDGAKLAAGGVQTGSTADKAGLKDGDVILEFEGKKVTDADALIVAIRARSVGDTVKMKVQRGNQTVDVSMTLQAATG